MERVLLLVILLIILLWMIYHRSIECFDDFFNPIQNIANITSPPPVSAKQMQIASQGITSKHQQYLANVYEQPERRTVEAFEGEDVSEDVEDMVNVGILASQSPDFTIAQTICEPVTTSDCNAFDNPDFNKYCGISFDVKNGKNTKDQAHIGGLYMDPVRKALRLEGQKRNPTKNYKFRPTYGSADVGLFAHNKATCNYIRDDIKCKASNVVGIDNCAVCFSDFSYHATDPANPNEDLTFVFYTNATQLSIFHDNKIRNKRYILRTSDKSETPSENVVTDPTAISVNGKQLTTTTIKGITINEGDLLLIIVGNLNNDPLLLGGYIQATTTNGEFKIDINIMIDSDAGKPPSVAGDVNGYTLYRNKPKTGMMLKGIMPFTFKGAETPDSRFNCSNAPFITTKGAMDYVATNEPCYGPDAKPGNYKMECLQQIFLSSGGTTKGTGYPGTQETAQVLLVDEAGKGRSLDKIGKFLYKKMVLASTGMSDGNKMPMKDWDDASMFMTGVHKAGPCDTAEGEPLSNDCLVSLYMSSGCFPKGKLNPDPAEGNPMNEGIAAGMSMGGAQGKATVSEVYKNAKDYANSTGINNTTRQKALMDCYGITLIQKS
jgi:hypothetical protein